jgi:hypothetical protein
VKLTSASSASVAGRPNPTPAPAMALRMTTYAVETALGLRSGSQGRVEARKAKGPSAGFLEPCYK